jgi:hypothetical protein
MEAIMKNLLSEIMYALVKVYGEQKAKVLMDNLIKLIKG